MDFRSSRAISVPRGASQVCEERVNLVVALERDHLARGDVFVTALDSISQAGSFDLCGFITRLHEAEGIRDYFVLGTVVAIVNFLTNEAIRDSLGIVIFTGSPSGKTTTPWGHQTCKLA